MAFTSPIRRFSVPIFQAPVESRQPAILVVEDDPDLVALLTLHLSDLGYRVESAGSGTRGFEMARTGDYRLLVLDVMLPGMDGLEICRRLRNERKDLPILMLTARSDEFDRVLGLDMGADDYLTKPFGIRELLARVKAILRRVDVEAQRARALPDPILHYGSLVLDTERRRVTLHGELVDLTNKEYELLLLFAQHPGRAYSRQELLDLVWGYSYSGYSHTVNSHINRLRGKIEADPAQPRFVQTVWGVGYRFAEPEEVV